MHNYRDLVLAWVQCFGWCLYSRVYTNQKSCSVYSFKEADVMCKVWRVIDLKEKMNHKLYYPLVPLTDRMCLYDVIRYGALQKEQLPFIKLKMIALQYLLNHPMEI